MADAESKTGAVSDLRNASDPELDTAAVPKESSLEPEAGAENSVAISEVLKGEGSRTFTMRELMTDLKEDAKGDGTNDGDARTPSTAASVSQDSSHQQQFSQNDSSMDLINNITGVDVEGRSRQKILAFAAKRYANAIERNPDDHDAYYNWALVLQESADSLGSDSRSSSKDALLEEACKKYYEATRLCPTLYDAFYNWAIAISDRAKIHGRTKEAEELWKQATQKYEKAVQLNWNTPQAISHVLFNFNSCWEPVDAVLFFVSTRH